MPVIPNAGDDAPQIRDLSPDERHILDVLLSRPFAGSDELRVQAGVVRVSGPSCTCGCPSLALVVDRSAPPTPRHGLPLPEGVGVDSDGNLVGALLFVDEEGYMNDLDVYAFGGTVDGKATEGRWGMPTVESFELAEWEPHADGLGGTLTNTPARTHTRPGTEPGLKPRR